LPEDWEVIEDWINNTRDVPKSKLLPPPELTLKNPEIPLLGRYHCKPPDKFWRSFPSNFPESARKGGVKIETFESLIKQCQSSWTLPEKHLAAKAVRKLKGELPVKLLKVLPALNEKNTKSAIKKWTSYD
jgi:hypothetical protein